MANGVDWEPGDDDFADDTADPALVRGGRGSTLLVLVGVVLVAVMGVNALTSADETEASPGPDPTTSQTWTPPPSVVPTPDRSATFRTIANCPAPLGGLLLTSTTTTGLSTADRTRCVAGVPLRQAVVLRREDGGSFAHLSAVVTWPLRTGTATPSELVPQARGPRTELFWELAGRLARVRGDLPESELADIVAGTRVSNGTLRVSAPGGLEVAYRGRYSPDVVHELRYAGGTVELPVAFGRYPGVFVGLQRGADVEMELLDGAVRAGSVGGRPAVIGTTQSGTVLAWQNARGVTAYVGLSGVGTDVSGTTLRDTLAALAAKVRTLSPKEYAALQSSLG